MLLGSLVCLRRPGLELHDRDCGIRKFECFLLGGLPLATHLSLLRCLLLFHCVRTGWFCLTGGGRLPLRALWLLVERSLPIINPLIGDDRGCCRREIIVIINCIGEYRFNFDSDLFLSWVVRKLCVVGHANTATYLVTCAVTCGSSMLGIPLLLSCSTRLIVTGVSVNWIGLFFGSGLGSLRLRSTA